MATRVFFLNTLHDNVEGAAYEKWVREVDYPLARGLPQIRRYDVTRLDGILTGEEPLPCQYLEVVDITDLEDYKAALFSDAPEVKAFFAEWSSFVAHSVAVHGEVIE